MDDLMSGIDVSGATSVETPIDAQPEATEQVTTPSTESTTESATPESSLNEADKPVTEEEVRAMIDDPRTPSQVKWKLERGLKYAEQFKTEKSEIESKYNEIQSKFAPFENATVSPADIERLTGLEQRILDISSFSATPDAIEKFVQETNPQAFQEFKGKAAWDALYTPDGKPDLDSWQVLIDRSMGYDPNNQDVPRVEVRDLLSIAEAIRDGRMSADDIEAYGDETTPKMRELAQQERQNKANAEFQETQIRSTEIGHLKATIQQEVQSNFDKVIDTFKLAPVDGEPKVAAEFKRDVVAKVGQILQSATKEIKGLSEIQKAVDLIGRASGKTPQEAVAEVRGLSTNPAYQRLLASGLSELNGKIEKIVAAEAYRYKLLMMGYEAENSKGQHAREIIGKPNQSTALPQLTAEQIASAGGRQRNQLAAQRFTQRARAGEPERLGG